MEKRYQVFISSTFQDLAGARQEVSEALLRADCFPAGMELFPAADEEQFEFIKQVIDQSDYYIVITAGRYGSIHPEKGLSYTELEYDYAVETGKPVIRLLHKDPFKTLAGEFIEQSDDGRERLRAFREKLSKGSMVNFWEDPRELGQLVVFGLMDARKRKPAIGWVRADGRASEEAEIETANLRAEVATLRLEIEQKNHRDSLKNSVERAIEIVCQGIFPLQDEDEASKLSKIFLAYLLSIGHDFKIYDMPRIVNFNDDINRCLFEMNERQISEVLNALAVIGLLEIAGGTVTVMREGIKVASYISSERLLV